VISPEGCAAILWKDSGKSREAARAMRITAQDLEKLDIVDEIIPEVTGGAHVDAESQAAKVSDIIERDLMVLDNLSPELLVAGRYERFRRLGRFRLTG
jgi:acetyl-CoA carboxylase carboxyl transferase subunit alpha